MQGEELDPRPVLQTLSIFPAPTPAYNVFRKQVIFDLYFSVTWVCFCIPWVYFNIFAFLLKIASWI